MYDTGKEKWLVRVAALVLTLSVLWIGVTLPTLAAEDPEEPESSSETTSSEDESSSEEVDSDEESSLPASSEEESGDPDSSSSEESEESSDEEESSEEESSSRSDDYEEDDGDAYGEGGRISSWDYQDDETISDIEWGEEFSEIPSEEPASSVIAIGTTEAGNQALHERLQRILWLPITTGILSLLALIVVNLKIHTANRRKHAGRTK